MLAGAGVQRSISHKEATPVNSEPYNDELEYEKPKRVTDDGEIYGAPDFDEPPRVVRRPARRSRWLLLGCLAVPLVCCVLPLCLLAVAGVGAATFLSRNEVTVGGVESIPVDPDQPLTLVIDNRVGSVDVRAGAGEEVVVSYTKKASSITRSRAQADLDDIQIDVSEADGTVRVEVINDRTADNFWAWASTVDLDISVPPALAVRITNNVGSIRIEDIEARGLDVKSNTGSIDFRGTLEPDDEATYSLETNVGSIELRLPSDVYAEIDAATDVGDISIASRFDAIDSRTDGRDGVSKVWEGVLGTGTDEPPLLRLRTNTGSIEVNTQ